MRDHDELNIVMVGMGDEQSTSRFRAAMQSSAPFICDPERLLYRMFGLTDGTMLQLLGPKVMMKAAMRMLAGQRMGKPIGDPKQLPGTFIVDREGHVRWGHFGTDASDVITINEIHAALEKIS